MPKRPTVQLRTVTKRPEASSHPRFTRATPADTFIFAWSHTAMGFSEEQRAALDDLMWPE